MYKRNTKSWVGVLYKLANAQDWYIKNDKVNGKVSVQTYATGGIGDITIMIGKKPDYVIEQYFTIMGNPVTIP